MALRFYDFLIIHVSYCLYTFDSVLCNIRYFRFYDYNEMQRMYQDFANTFLNFRIAELQL